jgi:hypothetical protein
MSSSRALQAALATRHAVIYGYGVAGAHLSARARRACLRRLDEHAAARDRIAVLVGAAGSTPAAASPAYALPFPVTDPTSAADLAAHLEDSVAGSAWDLVAASAAEGAARRLGIGDLAGAAAWASAWRALAGGGSDPALPGQPGSSQPSTTPTSSPSSSMTASGTTS